MKKNDLLECIRRFLKQNNITSVLVSRRDRFLSAYYPPDKDRLKAVSGFDGSAGTAFISLDRAVLFVDSRYTDQARRQATQFQVIEINSNKQMYDFLNQYAGCVLAVDADCLSKYMWDRLKEALNKDCSLTVTDQKSWDSLFCDVTRKKKATFFDYPEFLDGQSRSDKEKQIATVLSEQQLSAFYCSDPADVSWLTNRRSTLNKEYPVVFETGFFLTDQGYRPLTQHVIDSLIGKKTGYDPLQTTLADFRRLSQAGLELIPLNSPMAYARCLKNEKSLLAVQHAAWQDSVVFCRFLAFLEKHKDRLSEKDCVKKLRFFRKQIPFYFADSFDTISACDENAALAHYTPENQGKSLALSDVLLIDTGAHYMSGTTDMTRTIALKEANELLKRRYTQVLQGHIDLATSVLSLNDPICILDEKARFYLAQDQVGYGHATGHGIGQCLGVHDAWPIVAPSSHEPLKPNMVFSNEPGFYDIKNGFGIRLENMVVSYKNTDQTLSLETISLVPFDPRLIDFNMLTDHQKKWLKQYHLSILKRIFPHLTKSEQRTLTPLIDIFIKIN